MRNAIYTLAALTIFGGALAVGPVAAQEKAKEPERKPGLLQKAGEGLKTAGEATLKGAKAAAKGTEKGAEATAEGVGTAAEATAKGAKVGAKATAKGATVGAEGAATGAKATAKGATVGAKATAKGATVGAKATAKGATVGGKAIAKGSTVTAKTVKETMVGKKVDPYKKPVTIMEAQRKLQVQGYYSGAIDGIAGPKTQSGLREFQGDNQLKVTGKLNVETARALGLPAAE